MPRLLQNAALILVLLYTACFPTAPAANPPSTDQDPTPTPPATLTKAEFDLTVDNYIAYLLWAHATKTLVDKHRGQSLKIPMSQPDPACARQLRSDREHRPDIPPNDAVNCAMRGITSLPQPNWTQMSPIEREARSRRSLNWIYTSNSPIGLAKLLTDSRTNQQTKSTNEEALHLLHDTFISCASSVEHVTSLVEAEDHHDFATAWTEALQQAAKCANRLVTGK